MNCPNCNHELNTNSSTCSICGYSTESENTNASAHSASLIPAWMIGIIAFLPIIIIAVIGYAFLKPVFTIKPSQKTIANENFSINTTTIDDSPITELATNFTTQTTTSKADSNAINLSTTTTIVSQTEIDSVVPAESIYTAYNSMIIDNTFPYALADIDKNGVYELILKESWNEGQYRIYHIYTYKNNRVQSLGQFYYDYPMYMVKIGDTFYFAEDGLHTYISEIRLVENEIYIGENRMCTEKTSDVLFSEPSNFSDLKTVLGIHEATSNTINSSVIAETETTVIESEIFPEDELYTYAEAYLPLLQQAFMVDEYAEYCIYDLNADGINEIVIGTNLGGAMGLHQFFTLENGRATHCGEISGQGYLLEDSGNLYYETARMGYQEINQVQIFGNSIYMTLYFSSNEMMTEYLDFGTDLTYYYVTNLDPVYALDN